MPEVALFWRCAPKQVKSNTMFLLRKVFYNVRKFVNKKELKE